MRETIESARGDVSAARHALSRILKDARQQPRSSKAVLTFAGVEALEHLCSTRTKLNDLERSGRSVTLGARLVPG